MKKFSVAAVAANTASVGTTNRRSRAAGIRRRDVSTGSLTP